MKRLYRGYFTDTHINDLLYWRNFLLIEQNDCCFYTEVGDTARWRALPVACSG